MTFGATGSLIHDGVPAQRQGHEIPSSWLATHSRKVRLRRYARAMDWALSPEGILLGEVGGLAVRAYEDRAHATVLEVHAPGVLPLMEMVGAENRVAQVGDGMREVHLGDPVFERHYVVRAAEPWMARAVIDAGVRRSMLSAPEQSWVTVDDRVVSRSRARLEPLDLFARATALRVLVQAIPWEAYADERTLPSHEAVVQALAARTDKPAERQPSMPRRA